MNFNDFIGNHEVKRQLQTLFEQNKVFHAILLEGEKGLGKKTLANIIAQTAVCSHPEAGLACEICSNCKKVQKGIHPDVIYPEKTGVLQGYSIATVRKIRADAYIAANEARRKVYIFSEVDNMGIPAQNALLKVLEEPPENVIFILTCTNSANVLPTIRSRTQQMALKSTSQQELHKYLLKKFPNENLNEIWQISKGNIGIALDLITLSDWNKTVDITKKIALSLGSSSEFELLTLLAQVSNNKKDFTSMLSFFSSMLRDAMILSEKSSVAENNNCAKILSEKLSIRQILKLIDITYCAKNYVEKNVNLTNIAIFFCSSLFKISNSNL